MFGPNANRNLQLVCVLETLPDSNAVGNNIELPNGKSCPSHSHRHTHIHGTQPMAMANGAKILGKMKYLMK